MHELISSIKLFTGLSMTESSFMGTFSGARLGGKSVRDVSGSDVEAS